jgi:hypothetical protein
MAELPTQADIIREYFLKNPNRDIAHPEIVDWAVREYRERTGEVFRDPDRAIRKLHQQGWLIKVRKGVYRYDPDAVIERDLEDFSEKQKKEILKRDGYRCVMCGRGRKDKVELHVDHIVPKDKGGRATLANGQTLCAEHNFRKKNYSQTETGKKMFKSLLRQAREINDTKIIAFCEDILRVYEQHNINDHIDWQ